jgi:hypothetical protein
VLLNAEQYCLCLNGELWEEVYVAHHHQPPGFIIPGQEGKVLLLDKALYGPRQVPCAWNVKLDSMLTELGFDHSDYEHAV